MTCQENPIKGPSNSATITQELWERCAGKLNKQELEWFAGAHEAAELRLRNLVVLTEGLGCLIGSDVTEKGHLCAGNFQSHHDVPNLLFSLSESINSALALFEVSNAAQCRLAHPELYKFKD